MTDKEFNAGLSGIDERSEARANEMEEAIRRNGGAVKIEVPKRTCPECGGTLGLGVVLCPKCRKRPGDIRIAAKLEEMARQAREMQRDEIPEKDTQEEKGQ
jgi:uncharacterized protein (UPF0212 family)